MIWGRFIQQRHYFNIFSLKWNEIVLHIFLKKKVLQHWYFHFPRTKDYIYAPIYILSFNIFQIKHFANLGVKIINRFYNIYYLLLFNIKLSAQNISTPEHSLILVQVDYFIYRLMALMKTFELSFYFQHLLHYNAFLNIF